MLVDLVRVTTGDGVRLDGMLQKPTPQTASDLAVDALLLVHGTGGSFFSSSLFDSFAERFVKLGVAVLRINTRGHDLVSTAVTNEGARRQGAAYETVDDCRHDFNAWLDWLSGQGHARIGVVGHSSGAVKTIYSQTRQPHPAVSRLIAVSPPRLSYAWFELSSMSAVFQETYREAEKHIKNGRPQALMEVAFPLPMLITAEGYVEKYGPEERYNFLRYLDRLPYPTLFTFGSVEVADNVAFQALPESVEEHLAQSGRGRVEVIEGANHFYYGLHGVLIRCVEDWLVES